MDDWQGERLCRGFWIRSGNPDWRHPDFVADPDPVVGLYPPAIDADFAAADHAVDMAFRHAFETAQEEIVEPLRLAFFPDNEGGRRQGLKDVRPRLA